MRWLPAASSWKRFLLLTLVLQTVGGLQSALGESPGSPWPLDPATGEFDGRSALAVYPVQLLRDGPSMEAIALEDCRVHLTSLPATGPPPVGSDLQLPCTEWILPPSNRRYLAWVEGEWSITPFSGRFAYSGNAPGGWGMQVPLPVTEAGKVTVDSSTPNDGDLSLRLFRAEPQYALKAARDAWSRSDAVGEIGSGVLAPAGRAVAGLWKEKKARYVALSRPFQVNAHKTTAAPLTTPGEAADVMVRLRRVEWVENQDFFDVDLSLIRDEVAILPDLVVPAAYTLLAVWYEVEPGNVELRAESETQGLSTRHLDLASGEIRVMEDQMQLRPLLDVELELPTALDDEEDESLVLEIRRMPSEEVLVRRELRPGERLHRFERMPLSNLQVILETRVGSFKAAVDLSSGQDGFLLLDPPVVALHGSVYVGNESHPATLHFRAIDRSTHSVDTNEEGRYEVVAPAPVRSTEIALAGRDGVPWIEFFSRPLNEATELDFHLNDTKARVRVSDEVTGQPIPNATVVFKNHFVGRTEEDQSTAQYDKTDTEGYVLLPPLREGFLEVRAEAAGYRQMDESLQVSISEASRDQTVDVTLIPVGEGVTVQLQHLDGTPAAGANVLVVDSSLRGQILLMEVADDGGRVTLPSAPLEATVLVRHPDAAFFLRDWRPDRGDEERGETWVLPNPPSRTFHLQLFDEEGSEPSERGEIALWVQGNRLSGSVLAWLTLRAPMTDPAGSWSATNIPAGEVRVLAWGRNLHKEGQRGGLDAFAKSVPYPWPDVVEIEILH